jgi:hypothetical protein
MSNVGKKLYRLDDVYDVHTAIISKETSARYYVSNGDRCYVSTYKLYVDKKDVGSLVFWSVSDACEDVINKARDRIKREQQLIRSMKDLRREYKDG